MEFNAQRPECCEQCPFARTTPKEYLDTRGQNGPRFVAQAHMNALLPCHMEHPQGKADPEGKNRQCAGAAKFRANIGVAEKLKPELGRLPKDTKTVFANEVQLLAHHMGIPICTVELFYDDEKLGQYIAGEHLLNLIKEVGPDKARRMVKEHIKEHYPDDRR